MTRDSVKLGEYTVRGVGATAGAAGGDSTGGVHGLACDLSHGATEIQNRTVEPARSDLAPRSPNRLQRIALAVWRRRTLDRINRRVGMEMYGRTPPITVSMAKPYGITEDPATWFYTHPATYRRLKLTDRSIPCS